MGLFFMTLLEYLCMLVHNIGIQNTQALAVIRGS